MNKKVYLIGIIALMSVIVLSIFTIASGGSSSSSITSLFHAKPEIECTATLDGLLIGDANLKSAYCSLTGETCRSLLNMGNPLAFTSVSGKVIFDASDVDKVVQYSAGRFDGSLPITQKLCTEDKTVAVKLYNEQGALTGSQEVVVQV